MYEKIKPDIEISENYARSDLNAADTFYFLMVYLIDVNYNILDVFTYDDFIDNIDNEWKNVTHVFRYQTFEVPVRYILFYHAAKVCLFLILK